MKVLLDSCVWGGALAELRSLGHDVEAVSGWSADPGDEEILARAHSMDRVLVTLDKDFGELAVVRGRPHAGLVRACRRASRPRRVPPCSSATTSSECAATWRAARCVRTSTCSPSSTITPRRT